MLALSFPTIYSSSAVTPIPALVGAALLVRCWMLVRHWRFEGMLSCVLSFCGMLGEGLPVSGQTGRLERQERPALRDLRKQSCPYNLQTLPARLWATAHRECNTP